MLNLMSENNHMVNSQQERVNSHLQSFGKIEAHLKQIADILNREEEQLKIQSVANHNEHYMEDESISYHEKAIPTLRSEEVVENHMEERNEEQIEAP
jgi:uncharacterized membrane protein YheB (UPF0754 family)